MQRLTYIPYRFVRANHPSNEKVLILKRCLSNIGSNKNENQTSVLDELKGEQTKEALDALSKSGTKLAGGGKVWSVQNPGSVHVAPLATTSTTFVPTPPADGQTIRETTVHTTQGELHIADPLTTHPLQPEAAAASAFEPFPPNTPLAGHSTPTDTLFSPKISSTGLYSDALSPTSQYENVSTSTSQFENVSTPTSQFENVSTPISQFENVSTSINNSSSTDKTTGSTEIPIQRESDLRDEILRESLKYVGEKGWTMDAIRAGVQANNQPTTVEGLFSNGYDLVEYFMRDANAKMTAYMNEKSKKGEAQGTRLLIDGLKYRLGLVIPYAKTWDQALAQGALPQNAIRSWKNLLDLSSDAWHGIGDTSTDVTWYSKRLLLAAVYKSAEIYMLQDQSPDKIDTMNFLERRLSDFQSFGSVRNTMSKSLSDTAQVASGLFSVVRNLTSRR